MRLFAVGQKESIVQMHIGIWIDHKKAVLIKISEAGEEFEQIQSNVARQCRRSGEEYLREIYQPLQLSVNNGPQTASTDHLAPYYDSVFSRIHHAQSILLMGPAEAKVELRNRLERSCLGDHISSLEVAYEMSNRQIVKKVRSHFLRVPIKPTKENLP